MEEYSFTSHQRAVTAASQGRFDREIVPLAGVNADEGPRADTTLEKMAALKTLTQDGRLTAAVCSQISDGAAALLIASERAVRTHGLTPRGQDPSRLRPRRRPRLGADGADPGD
jgi:acetyl-CoA C-acetyltransferase